jgi:methyl-accepting chemotaxis protein
MSDLFERVTNDQDIFKKLLGKIPGFNGYVERQNRRSADKLLRDTLADRFEALWQRISDVQGDLINQGAIEFVDDLEAAALKLRQFIDRIRTASYGYAGLFDAIKVNSDELARIYEYDLALLNSVDEVARAIENVEASIGTDGLPASIRNLTTLSQQCVDAFNQRSEVIKAVGGGESATTITPPAA